MACKQEPLIPATRLGSAPAVERPLLSAVAARVADFAATLDEGERAALRRLIEQAAAPQAALALTPAAALLDADELDAYQRLCAEPDPVAPGPRAQLVMVMKATRLCNLRCTYCHFWREGTDAIMPFAILARATRAALRPASTEAVEFVWHGGEATLLPVRWFEKAVWLQEHFRRPGQLVRNTLQTNGARLSDEWIAFCRRHDFNVGVSLDGPPELHDARRVDAAGRPTSARAREALLRLRLAGVAHGVLLVVDDAVADAGAGRILDYFLDIGVTSVGILNAIPENVSADQERTRGAYLGWGRFVAFLRELQRLWWPAHKERIWFRELGDLMGRLRGEPAQTCYYTGDCFGTILTVEPNGDLGACDKYIGDRDYAFGNIGQLTLAHLAAAPALRAVQDASAAARDGMHGCRWYHACRGACPHDRYLGGRRGAPLESDCCGLAPLMEDIDQALEGDQPKRE